MFSNTTRVTHNHIHEGNLSTVRASEFLEKEVQSTFDEIK